MEPPLAAAQNTITNIGKNIPEINPQQIATNVSEGVTKGLDTVKAASETVQSQVSNTMNDYSSQNMVSASNEFLNSNSIIAKFVFLILVLIVFSFLVNLGIYIVIYFTKRSTTPYLINGMVPGNSNTNIVQDPKNSGAVTIARSNNQPNGLEMTWSTWLIINDLNVVKSGTESFSHIFNKGNSNFSATGVASVNNAPGVYIGDGTNNTIRVYMDTVTSNANFLDISGVPLQKWFHLAVRIKNNIMDVYMNGVISGRQLFTNVPKQNYDDVHIGFNGGFNGNVSNLVYYDRALGVFEINNIILRGPNVTLANSSKSNLGYYSYLSSSWYFNKMNF